MTLQGQTAIVTGGANGIGLATVKVLLREGANVVLSDISVRGEAVVQELQAEFGTKRCLFVKADVRSDAEMEDVFATTKKNFKKLDIVANCAGLLNDLDWNMEVDINLKGVIRGTMLAWKYMGKHEGGSGGTVINIASIAALMAIHVTPIYAATKHAIVGFGRAMGEEYHLNRTGIRVITLCPGVTETAIFSNAKLLSPDLEDDFAKTKASFPIQSTHNVAEGVLQVIKKAASGSVWVSEEEQPAYQVDFPAKYQDMRRAE